MIARLLQKYGTALAGVAMFAAFAVASDRFLTAANLFVVLKQISFITILALGFALALITAELDLSFGSVCSLGAVVCGGLIHHGYGIPIAVAAGLATGLLFGLANGLLVTRAKIPSLIATLATGSIAVGCAFMITGGVAFVGRWKPEFLWIGRGSIGGVPILALWTALAAVLCLFLIKQTRLGLHMVATGEAEDAARLAGIATRRMKLLGLAASGLAAGVTAVLLTSSLSSADAQTAADFLLIAIAAVLLGMTMFEPGRANVPGTIVGALMIGGLSNGLVLAGAPYYVQHIVLGLIILASVGISASTLTRAAFSV
ncbi:MAG: sugar ABC transporter permease [Thalassobaculales bacterium]